MSKEDTIVKGSDNDVVFVFDWRNSFATLGLNNFDKIQVMYDGNNDWNSVDDPINVEVLSPTELRLAVGRETTLADGEHAPIIKGTRPSGRVETLSCPGYEQVNKTKVVTC